MNISVEIDSKENIPFELMSMAEAFNYHQWLMEVTLPFFGNRICEIGSGIGTMSQYLPQREILVLSDVDNIFVKKLESRFFQNSKIKILHSKLDVSIQGLLEADNIDTFVSFNVLEHVENDIKLLNELILTLRNSKAKGPKRLVSVVPAHQWALGEIDKSFGHLRRYSREDFLNKIIQAGGSPVPGQNYQSHYINSLGLLGWYLNGKILKKDRIGLVNVKTFELICPFYSKIENLWRNCFGLPFGNSLVSVYTVNES